MLRFAFVLAALTSVAPAVAQDAPAPATPAAEAVSPATTTKISATAMATDPRMLAAVRHANAMADVKCGVGVGANVDLATKATAQRCRRRMVEVAKLDAEGEIEGR